MAARDVILVTGAAGYIGSHIVRFAHEAGCKVLAVDWCGEWPKLPTGITLYDSDFVDVFMSKEITGVIHCAGVSSVSESMRDSRGYIRQNTTNTLRFLDHLSRRANPPRFVYLSSAAVYSAINGTLNESAARLGHPCSAYGASKLAVEAVLPWYQAHKLYAVALRLFNVAGAHPDGTLRENHVPESHLIPNAIDAALKRNGKLHLEVFGNDYQTRDGTSVRDFVHVMDVARACLFALDALDANGPLDPINIGSGYGSTVLEVVDEVVKNLKRPVPVVMQPRREGDTGYLVANIHRAEQCLGWIPGRSQLSTIVDDAIRSRP